MSGGGGARQLSRFKRALVARLKPAGRPSAEGSPASSPDKPLCFDVDWYLEQYPEVAELDMPPWVHYERIGAEKGYDPCEFFWTSWYVDRNPDVAEAGVNPLWHYEVHGAREGRAPSLRFDGAWYAAKYAIQPTDANPLAHFLTIGRARGYRPSEEAQPGALHSRPACFDAEWYLEQYPEVASLGMRPWDHYDWIGARKGYDPCEFFWTSWYIDRYQDVARSGVNPLLHYEIFGAREGRSPSPRFDPVWYAANYCLQPSDENPLAHFMAIGRAKGYLPSEEIAHTAFKRGDGTFNANHLLHASLDSKFERSGKSAYYDGRLTDGRSYAAEHGLALEPAAELDAIAAAMASEGAYCLPPYLAKFRNVIVIPGSTLLIAENGIICDEITAAKSIVPPLTQQKLWDRVWVKDANIALRYDIGIAPRIPAGIHLFKEHEQNYFHFLCELMPKLYLLEKLGLASDVPLLVCDDLNPRLYEIIDLLKNKARKIIKLKRNVPYVVETLTYLSDITNVTDVYGAKPSPKHTFLPEKLLAEMSESLVGSITTRRDGGRRLYLPRDSKRRAIVNEGEIIEAMVRDRYETPSLESLTFPAQIELFANAELIIGGTGAAFTNLLWCRPGTKAVILYPNHPYNNTTFWDRIARARSVDVTYIEGVMSGKVRGIYSMHDDFKIDLSELRRVAP